MNIMFFLTPKAETSFISTDMSLRQTLEKMEHHRFSALPLTDRDGKYVGVITEGDLLWGIKNIYNLDLKEAEKIPILSIPRRHDYDTVSADTDFSFIVDKALNQNFVPVVDSRGMYIGIITRRKVIENLYNKSKDTE